MKRSRIIILLALLLTLAVPCAMAARPSAKSVVENSVKKLRAARSITASFTANAGDGAVKGNMVIAGRKFTMDTKDLKVWFDGKTQWAYSPSSQEVNVTTPSPAELAGSNPMSVLTNMTSAYSVRRLSSSADSDRIEMIPKGNTDIAKVVVTFSSVTGFPVEMVVTGTDRNVTTIKIHSLKTGSQVKDAQFRFDRNKYPKAELIDLR